MLSMVLLLLFSSLLTAVLTPVFRALLIRYDVVDYPDTFRRVHSFPVPRAGGIPLAISFGLSYAFLLLLPLPREAGIESSLQSLQLLFPAAGIVFLTGLIDDIAGLSPWQKLVGQAVAASVAFSAGVRITAVLNHPFDPWLSFPVTVLWLLGCTNAINLLDGLDGLAAGAGLFAASTTLLAGWVNHDTALIYVTAPLVGALAAFLAFNFMPASIFLGDSGSLFIGFLLGCYGVLWSQKSATLFGMIAPPMLLVLPLLDTSFAVLRRVLSRKSIFEADRGHIHHRLLDRGYSPRRVVLTLYGVSGLAAALSLLQSLPGGNHNGLIIFVFCTGVSAAIWYALHSLGYIEIGLASKMILRGDFTRRNLLAELALRELQLCLEAAQSIETCWAAIARASQQLGFASVGLHLDYGTFEADFEEERSRERWSISIPFTDTEYLALGCNIPRNRSDPLPSILIVELRKLVGPKTRALRPPAVASRRPDSPHRERTQAVWE